VRTEVAFARLATKRAFSAAFLFLAVVARLAAVAAEELLELEFEFELEPGISNSAKDSNF